MATSLRENQRGRRRGRPKRRSRRRRRDDGAPRRINALSGRSSGVGPVVDNRTRPRLCHQPLLTWVCFGSYTGTTFQRNRTREHRVSCVGGYYSRRQGGLSVANEERDERFTAIEDRYADYTVYDKHYEKIGKVDDLFVDENDRPEYVGVKMGLLGTRSTLIPIDIVRVNDKRRLVEVAAEKEAVENGPTFDDDSEITAEFERQVLAYYRLETSSASAERRAYGAYYSDAVGDERVDLQPGERAGAAAGDVEREGLVSPGHEGPAKRGTNRTAEDKIRVQRSEEELVAGTGEREAGAVKVRKRVRTDRERLAVPKKREEVSVERVPVNEEGRRREAPEAGIVDEDDEIRIPIVEEEVVVEKRPVVKEEIRLRKEVVEEEEVVEADVRKEEVDVEDRTTRRNRQSRRRDG